MKCTNPNCGGEWTPPPGKSVTVCPFCQEPIVSEKKTAQSFDNVVDTLIYIKEQHGVDVLLGGKVYTYFGDLTRNQLRDEKDLIKQFCEKGALDCLKAAIGKPGSEHEPAIKRALSKLPKYLQDSTVVADMLYDFAEALGWKRKSNKIIVAPSVGSVISVAGIDWRVLDVQNNKALLISEKILEKRPYNVQYTNVTWEQCDLRKYLNGNFYNKLGAAKSAIAETHNSNPNNPWYGTSGGNITTDKVFLLSLDELVKYFGDSGALAQKQGKAIEYHYYDKGSKTFKRIPKPDPNEWCVFRDQYDTARIANYGSEGASWWWLRSPGDDSSNAAYVGRDSRVNVFGNIVFSVDDGVRPALWLNL